MSNTYRPDTPDNPTPVSHALLAVGKTCPLVDAIFAGPIASIPGYQHRPGQLTLAQTIRRAWKQGAHAITEGQTGCGKTYATLVPAILHALETGKPVVVSTRTLALQQQLKLKDLPTLREALTPWLTDKFGRTFTYAVRKGISNYHCQAKAEAQEDWDTDDGDLDTLPPEMRAGLATDHHACPGSKCRLAATCWYLESKRAARTSDLIIVNHALLMKALLSQPGTVLPQWSACVVDEAHELEREARECRGTEITEKRVNTLATRVLEFCGEHRQGVLWQPCRQCDNEGLGGMVCGCECHDSPPGPCGGAPDTTLPTPPQVAATVHALLQSLSTGEEATLLPDLKTHPASYDLEELQGQLKRLHAEVLTVQDQYSDVDEAYGLATTLAGSLNDLASELRDISSPRSGRVAWVQGSTLHAQPLDVAQFLRDSSLLETPVALSSATLATGTGQDAFAYIQEALGIRTMHQVQAASPFEWQQQAWLYLPEEGLHEGLLGLKERNALKRDELAREYCRVSAMHIREVLKWTRGRAFLLFSSRKALETTKHFLTHCTSTPCVHCGGPAGRVCSNGMPWTHITQGEMGQGDTLDWFRSTPGAVLFGLDSYSQGVDVVGDALSCVVMDRIPFAPPSDLLHAARVAAAGRQGFQEISVPLAVTKLRQGCGRLIRTVWDRGLLVLLDPRLRGKHAYILDALPPARRITRAQLKHVPLFLAASGEPVEGPAEVLHGLLGADTAQWTPEHRAWLGRLQERLPVLPPGLWRVGAWLLETYKRVPS